MFAEGKQDTERMLTIAFRFEIAGWEANGTQN